MSGQLVFLYLHRTPLWSFVPDQYEKVLRELQRESRRLCEIPHNREPLQSYFGRKGQRVGALCVELPAALHRPHPFVEQALQSRYDDTRGTHALQAVSMIRPRRTDGIRHHGQQRIRTRSV